MSHFFYIHADMSKKKDVWKIGISITPYSAVRARQKYCSEKFGLDHLFFGFPDDIKDLERYLKEVLFDITPRDLLVHGNQTELFQITEEQLLHHVNALIELHNFQIIKCDTFGKYTASRSGDCPYGIPSERLSNDWCNNELIKHFSSRPTKKLPYSRHRFSTTRMFHLLFDPID